MEVIETKNYRELEKIIGLKKIPKNSDEEEN